MPEKTVKLPVLIMGLVVMSVLAFVATTSSAPKTKVFSRAGAKAVSVAPSETQTGANSMMGSIHAFANWMSGTDTGQDGTDSEALNARHTAEAAGATAFDAGIQARKND